MAVITWGGVVEGINVPCEKMTASCKNKTCIFFKLNYKKL